MRKSRYHILTLKLFALLNKNKKRKLSNFFYKKSKTKTYINCENGKDFEYENVINQSL